MKNKYLFNRHERQMLCVGDYAVPVAVTQVVAVAVVIRFQLVLLRSLCPLLRDE